MAGRVKEALIATVDSGASAQAFAANAGRRYLSITNTHATQTLYVRFSTSAASAAVGIAIAAGVTKSWGDNTNKAVPGSAVQVIGSGAATTFYGYEHAGDLVG